MSRFKIKHGGSAVVFGIALWILIVQSRMNAGPGSPGGGGSGNPPPQCKNEDALFSYASGWLCGGPRASTEGDRFCQCVLSSLSGSDAPLSFEWNLGQASAEHDFIARAAGGLTIHVSSHRAQVELREFAGSTPGVL
jgi:hypothetical protein